MRVAIMQPTYLPWLGYFDMMAKADIFILLDNVQFEKSSWQQRNRVRNRTGPVMLSVPVRKTGRFGQLIRDVEIIEIDRFWDKHLRTLELNYARAPYGDQILSLLREEIEPRGRRLGSFNAALISVLAEFLGIETQVVMGSQLAAQGKRAQLSANQVLEVGGDVFLAASGSRSYVELEPRFNEVGIAVEFHDFVHPTYDQLYDDFIPYLSVLDAIAMIGPQTRALLEA